MPDDVEVPPIWLLGSSGYSAELAASVGMGFAFAHHFAHYDAAEAIGRYRNALQALASGSSGPTRSSRPRRSRPTARPQAERLAATLDFNYVRRAQGDYRPLVSPEEALAYPYSAAEERARQANRERLFVGSARRPARAARRFAAAVAGGRTDDHHRDLRPRRAQRSLRAAGRGVRARARAGTAAEPRPPFDDRPAQVRRDPRRRDARADPLDRREHTAAAARLGLREEAGAGCDQ